MLANAWLVQTTEFYKIYPVKSNIIYGFGYGTSFQIFCEKCLRVPWWHSGYYSGLSLPWPRFKPWLGNSDPASLVAWPKKKR